MRRERQERQQSQARQGRRGGRGRRFAVAAVVGVLTLGLLGALGGAAAHGGEPHLDAQLVREGERLIVGDFTAPQAGALVVVPYVEGPLGCGASAGGYRVPLSAESGVSFVANETTLQAFFDAPGAGFSAFAVDSHTASRALILMQENAVALHGLVALVQRESANATSVRTGVLGLPYPIPGAGAGHGFDHTAEGGGVVMSYDNRSFTRASACAGDERGHVALDVPFDAFRETPLRHGALVHVVAMHDPEIPEFLPRPIDASTQILQANLYLARPGEDPERVRDALAPGVRAHDAIPLAGLGLALALIAWRR